MKTKKQVMQEIWNRHGRATTAFMLAGAIRKIWHGKDALRDANEFIKVKLWEAKQQVKRDYFFIGFAERTLEPQLEIAFKANHVHYDGVIGENIRQQKRKERQHSDMLHTLSLKRR